MDDIIVLGAGLAGLGFAHENPSARIFEKNQHPGGRAFSCPVDGYFFDQGAHISHTKKEDFRRLICSALDKVNQIKSSNVSNYWKGLWMTYPVQNHLNQLPQNQKVEALIDLVMSHVDQNKNEAVNYLQWCQKQYGNFLTHNFYEVFTQKYWRVEMEQLATDWLGGRLIPSLVPNIIRGAFSSQQEKQTSFNKFYYPKQGGFFAFFESLYSELDIQFNEKAVELDVNKKQITFSSGRKESYDILANSIPLPELINMINPIPASVKQAVEMLRHTKLLCVNMVISKPALTKNHWCYIYDHDIGPARVSFPGNLSAASEQNEVSMLQAEIFRRDNENWDTESLTQDTISQMANMYGFDAQRDVALANSFVVPYAYVISDINRQPLVSYLLSWLREKDVFSMGLYGKWKYVWSDVAYYSGRETANEIKEQLCQV